MSTRILYVDDEPDLREIATFALALDPALEVKACASGAEALEVIGRWRPDLVVLDVVMEEMDGPATLARLRQTAAGEAVPIVFITARPPSDEAERLLALGAIGIIAKPFDPMTLAETVRAHLGAGGASA
jgi:CheY-like chemotaxis protein